MAITITAFAPKGQAIHTTAVATVREVLGSRPRNALVIEMLDRAIDRCHRTGVPVTVVRVPVTELDAAALRLSALRDMDVLVDDGAQWWAILAPGGDGTQRALDGLAGAAIGRGAVSMDVAEWTVTVADASGFLATLQSVALEEMVN